MEMWVKGLLAAAVLAFVLAVAGSSGLGPILGVSAEGFSRASTNLALFAIALAVMDGRWGASAD